MLFSANGNFLEHFLVEFLTARFYSQSIVARGLGYRDVWHAASASVRKPFWPRDLRTVGVWASRIGVDRLSWFLAAVDVVTGVVVETTTSKCHFAAARHGFVARCGGGDCFAASRG